MHCQRRGGGLADRPQFQTNSAVSLLDPPLPDWAQLARWLARHYPEVPQIDADALHAWLHDPARQPPLLLDIRSPDEQAVSTLPGARCVANAAQARRAVYESLAREIVVYCAVGVRSVRLARTLLRGDLHVLNLSGAIFGWANRGYPLVKGGAPAAYVHPYDSRWEILLAPERRANVIG
jgi:rhodanese-related sulfurtransferase